MGYENKVSEKKLLEQLLEGETIYVEGGELIKKLYCTVSAMGYYLHVEEENDEMHRLYILDKDEMDQKNGQGVSADIFD